MPCSARTWNRPFSVSPARSALRPPSFGKSPIAWFTLLQSVPNILPPEPIINKESSIGVGSTSLPSLRNYAALSRSFLGQIHFQNRPCALPRRRGNVVMGAWQRCYGGVATLLWRRGNVVMGAWQRCYGGVATLLWRRGNVVTGAWQPVGPHLVAGRRLVNMTRRLLLFAKRLSVCFFRAAVSISSISSFFPLLSACSHPAPVHPLWPPRISCKFYLVLRGCQLLP